MAIVNLVLNFEDNNASGAGQADGYNIYRAEQSDPCPGGVIDDSKRLGSTPTMSYNGQVNQQYVDTTSQPGVLYYYRVGIVRGTDVALGGVLGPFFVEGEGAVGYPGNTPDENANLPYTISSTPFLHHKASFDYVSNNNNYGALPDNQSHNLAANYQNIRIERDYNNGSAVGVVPWKQGGTSGTVTDVPIYEDLYSYNGSSTSLTWQGVSTVFFDSAASIETDVRKYLFPGWDYSSHFNHLTEARVDSHGMMHCDLGLSCFIIGPGRSSYNTAQSFVRHAQNPMRFLYGGSIDYPNNRNHARLSDLTPSRYNAIDYPDYDMGFTASDLSNVLSKSGDLYPFGQMGTSNEYFSDPSIFLNISSTQRALPYFNDSKYEPMSDDKLHVYYFQHLPDGTFQYFIDGVLRSSYTRKLHVPMKAADGSGIGIDYDYNLSLENPNNSSEDIYQLDDTGTQYVRIKMYPQMHLDIRRHQHRSGFGYVEEMYFLKALSSSEILTLSKSFSTSYGDYLAPQFAYLGRNK